ncbi:DgyrCDS7699 [Dimorphilus gyrociliatus]|uniref:non-specific serine/threonine protein kinase n=1 Tax=Dimorphilus gyrociliatus TaxID=2664684 RepID=A0A7I8VS04_9ANNE|nr:DgyrCDS7699 [Dimorphilus gyrociliatus]
MSNHSDREDNNYINQFRDDDNYQEEINPKRSARKVSRLLIVCNAIHHLATKRKVESFAIVPYVNPSTGVICLSGIDEKILNFDNLTNDDTLKEFFLNLTSNFIDDDNGRARFDLLGCNNAKTNLEDLKLELRRLLGISVGISKDISGSDIIVRSTDSSRPVTVCDLYFKSSSLKTWKSQPMAGFEKIRTVGKGAYGAAILYRKKDDDSLVILKEINLLDLNAQERQLALNEAKVLAKLDHPHIISYYDSFEEDGKVIIEMEYADGGNLAQFLAKQDNPLEEKKILGMFKEIVSAIMYIHKSKTLHRDLKTQNIFLTKEGHCKIGDFGISKVMTTHKAANTVLGTPYYISPEMCEGKPYNEKSDIWALGCILYEMACLQRTFEGSNLPALVNKIMKGKFEPVKGSYSNEFKTLISDMLQKEPEFRPTALELHKKRVPELLSKFRQTVSEEGLTQESRLRSNSLSFLDSAVHRSVLYFFKMDAIDVSLVPVPLPSKVKIKDMAVGRDHIIVVTVEHCVYSWGCNEYGQLGHGDTQKKFRPQTVDGLKNKSIVRLCAGSSFSVFGSDNGLIMTCGDGSFGCLGHKDMASISKPRLVEELLSVDILHVACGPRHVVAVEREGKLYSWGCGDNGRTGLGHEKTIFSPEVVKFSENISVKSANCGRDGTMIVTDLGSVYACGSNLHNKLALNERQGFLMAMKNIFAKTDIDGTSTFVCVRSLARHCIKSISMGDTHTAVLLEGGRIITFGKNSVGQLGMGDTKSQKECVLIKFFESSPATIVKCGPSYSVAVTHKNEIVRWGRKYRHDPDPVSYPLVSQLTRSASQPVLPEKEPIESDTQLNSDPSTTQAALKRSTSVSARERHDSQSRDDLVLKPTPVLYLDSSGAHSPDGETVTLSNLICNENKLFLQVETTAPPPPSTRKKKRRRNFLREKSTTSFTDDSGVNISRPTRMSASSRDGGDELSSSEMDNSGPLPTWLQKEVDLSTNEEDRNNFLANVDKRTNGNSIDERMNNKYESLEPKDTSGDDSKSQRPPIYKRNSSNAQNLIPTKSKAGPSSTTKIRHKSKSKAKSSQSEGDATPKASIEIDAIASQVEKLKKDKEETDQHLRKVVDDAAKAVADIRSDSEKKTAEMEEMYRQQIGSLEQKLDELKVQLEKIPPKQQVRESRICSIQ